MDRSVFDIQAEFCKAMGNATRLEILHLLREGPMTVSEITRVLGKSQSGISRQLAVLRSVGVVTGARSGTEMRYHITDEKIGEVCDLVQKVLMEQTQRQSDALSDL
ncbi:MAG: ArsR/SmtB family transcription factor [Anaerolineales bacterium]|jgi:DNA-binding transcriptional ArsR family regulator